MFKLIVGGTTIYAGYQAFVTCNWLAIGATIILIAVTIAVFSARKN